MVENSTSVWSVIVSETVCSDHSVAEHTHRPFRLCRKSVSVSKNCPVFYTQQDPLPPAAQCWHSIPIQDDTIDTVQYSKRWRCLVLDSSESTHWTWRTLTICFDPVRQNVVYDHSPIVVAGCCTSSMVDCWHRNCLQKILWSSYVDNYAYTLCE